MFIFSHSLVCHQETFHTEFQALLYDVVKQVITGGLEIDDTISFFNDLTASLVR